MSKLGFKIGNLYFDLIGTISMLVGFLCLDENISKIYAISKGNFLEKTKYTWFWKARHKNLENSAYSIVILFIN